jgi:hypothetical protein
MADYLGSSIVVDVAGAGGGVNVIGPIVGDIPPDPPDVDPPEISDVTPTPSTPIDPLQAIAFDVTDNAALARVFVFAVFANGDAEVVHDGHGFARRYATSTREEIEGGFHFDVRRVGGWPSAFVLRVRALDTRGNES